MYIVLNNDNQAHVKKAIEIAKKDNLTVHWLRDGEHSTKDLEIILTFQDEGFKYTIERFKSKYDSSAIEIVFYLPWEE